MTSTFGGPRRGRALGVDFGSVRIGIAVSDELGILATPLAVIHRSGTSRSYRSEILSFARTEAVARIVIGLPVALSGVEGPAAIGAREEAEAISQLAGDDFAVELYDERFTTVIAERALRGAGVGTKRRREVIDRTAAAVMLQSWLEARS